MKQRFTPYNIEDTLTPEQIALRRERIRFRKSIDEMYEDKYPKMDFILATDSVSVREAYNRMINNRQSDYKITNKMRIIKRGEIVKKEVIKTCYSCNTKFSYVPEDIKYDRDGDYIICPLCNKFIGVS